MDRLRTVRPLIKIACLTIKNVFKTIQLGLDSERYSLS